VPQVKQARHTWELRHFLKNVQQVIAVCKGGVRPQEAGSVGLGEPQSVILSRNPGNLPVQRIEPAVVLQKPYEYTRKEPVDGGLRDRFIGEGVVSCPFGKGA